MSGFSGRQWLLALGIATLIHGGTAFFLLRPPPSSGSVAAGAGGINVSLGPAGRAPGSAETVPPPTPENAEPFDELSEVTPLDPPTEEVPPELIEEVVAPKASDAADAMVAKGVDPDSSRDIEVNELEATLVESAESEDAREVAVTDAAPMSPASETRQSDTQENDVLASAVAIPERTEDPAPTVAEASVIAPDDVSTRSPDSEPANKPVPPSPRKPPALAEEWEEPQVAEPAQIAGAGGEAGDQEDGDLGSGQTISGGGTVGATSDYYATLQAWLERHKVYPRRALSRRLEGVASLRFVMDRKGRVLDYLIERSSGHRLLDNAVETLIERAQPLPTMPDDIEKASLTLTVLISFELN